MANIGPCETCLFWHSYMRSPEDEGDCCRRAPVVLPSGFTKWPLTPFTGECGEWKPREEAEEMIHEQESTAVRNAGSTSA